MTITGSNNQSENYRAGESGPRRSTQASEPGYQDDEPIDTAAANAAASLFAEQMGLSSSRRGSSVRLGGNNVVDLNNNVEFSPSGSSYSSKKKGGGIRQFLSRRSSSNMVDNSVMDSSNRTTGSNSTVRASGGSAALPPAPYVAMQADGTAPLSTGNTTNTANQANNPNNSTRSNRSIQYINGPRPTSPPFYKPPAQHTTTATASSTNIEMMTMVDGSNASRTGGSAQLIRPEDTKSFDDNASMKSADGQPRMFDAYGHRAPYREGPYDCHHDETGRLIKKRWYGRMEDGYLAWSSIYLHENLGLTIYMPLTEEEEELMKADKYIPNWMYEFTSLPNVAIPLSYFCIGVALQLLRTPLIVYFIQDQGASAAEVNVLFTVMAVPWCFKVIYGFLSDCCPISGLRRKPYFMTGWLIYIVANFLLMVPEAPSIGMCIFLVFVQTAGYMLADVMTDALIVERSRFETQEKRGTMQSKGYIVRFFGSTVGAIIGAVVYNKDEWEWYLPIRAVFFINGALPLIFLLPVAPYLLELDTHCQAKNFYQQCRELFEVVQLRAVWQPMTFVYVYNSLQLTNAAWMNFLVEGLHFSAWMIGIVSIVGSIMSWFGIMTYKKFFFASNWRIVYFWCTTLASVIALGQLILVFGLNKKINIPDIVFSMGDDVLVEFVIAVQFLPMCIMYLGLCPPGSEGTTYAMLTTWSNLAGSLAFDISTALTVVWDVGSQTIADGDYSGVWKLSLLCGLVGPIPLLMLGLIPKNKEDQRRLQEDETRHRGAGIIFITVMIVTLAITFIESIYEVYFHDEAEYGDYEDGAADAVRRRLKRLLVGH